VSRRAQPTVNLSVEFFEQFVGQFDDFASPYLLFSRRHLGAQPLEALTVCDGFVDPIGRGLMLSGEMTRHRVPPPLVERSKSDPCWTALADLPLGDQG